MIKRQTGWWWIGVLAARLIVSACGTAGSKPASSGTGAVPGRIRLRTARARHLPGRAACWRRRCRLLGRHQRLPALARQRRPDGRTPRRTAVRSTQGGLAMTNGLMARGPRRARRRFVVGAVAATSAGVLALTAYSTAAGPADAAYFDAQKQTFLTQGLARYNQLISDIKATYAGTPVGASESIFSP